MVQALVGMGRKLAFIATLGGVFVLGSLAQQDPPSRVARLNYISGNVSMEPAGTDDWAPAEINHPFTVGDYVYADAGARAELHLDIAAIRMGSQTNFGFLNLNDQTVQIKLTEGDMYFRLHQLGPDQVFEIDTPNAAVQLLRDGVYRFRVDPNGAMSFLVVREGQAEITGGGQAFTINPGNSVLVSGADQHTFDVENAPASDDFDSWCMGRDTREARAASRRYLPPTVIGYEDLDQYGAWQQEAEYGPVWYPSQVATDWAPYHSGRWAWVEPWGWTWVDAAPWGFAPFHYGRWAYIHNRWGWCPGPIAVVGYHGPIVRPYYAPALVAWFGGAHWDVSIATGPSLGWVPLGFGEVYTPAYACSRHYFSNVNVYNTRIVKNVNIINVYNTVYVNKTVYNRQFVNVHVPNAVYAMHSSAFAGGQPVHRAGFVLRDADLQQIGRGAVISPGVAPAQQALFAQGGHPAAHPLPQVVSRQVVAVSVPAAVPAAFTVRQQYLQTHANEVHNFAAMHQAVAARVLSAEAIRPALPVQPVRTQPGQHFGHSAGVQEHSNIPPQQPVVSAQPRRQPPSAQPVVTHPLPPQPAYNIPPQPTVVQPLPPQPTHGAPPNMRSVPNPEANRNERSSERPFPQPNQNRPSMERPQAQSQPQQNKSAEQHFPPPAIQPQHERPAQHIAPQPPQHEHPRMEHSEPHVENRPAPEAQHTSPPASHVQPPLPPAGHGEQHHDHPPEHNSNSGQHNNGHNERKPQLD